MGKDYNLKHRLKRLHYTYGYDLQSVSNLTGLSKEDIKKILAKKPEED